MNPIVPRIDRPQNSRSSALLFSIVKVEDKGHGK